MIKRMGRQRCLTWMLGLLCSWFNMALAADHQAFTVEEVIKDIPPASFSCEVDNNDKLLGTGNHAMRLAPDMHCAMTAAALSEQLIKQNNLTLVDTRTRSEYALATIPGALHFAPSSLKHKSYLKQKSLVLIGNGNTDQALYSRCAELKAQGFSDVKVLQGGLLSWLMATMPINGKVSASQLGHLEPLELWAASQFQHNMVVIHPSQAAFKEKLPNGLLVDALNVQQFKQQLQQWRRKHPSLYLSSVLLVLPKAAVPSQIQALRAAVAPTPVLLHAGTYQRFTQQLRQHQAVVLARQKGPKKPRCHL